MKDDPFEIELGNALADRLGLNHATTLREYDTEHFGTKVKVAMTTMVFIPTDEYEDLRKAAAIRAGVA
jgi:hypothetical protein